MRSHPRRARRRARGGVLLGRRGRRRRGAPRRRDPTMKVAIVHDWLVTFAGAERVLEQLLAVYPEADLYSLIEFVPREQRGFLGGREVRTSFLGRLPWAR